MRIHIIGWLGPEGGELRAFANKANAEKLRSELIAEKLKQDALGEEEARDGETGLQIIFDTETVEIPISAQGLLDAIELGARKVYK